MLYSEFVIGTGCADTKHNYHVFEAVSAMYVGIPTMTKKEAYIIAAPYLKNEVDEECLLRERIEAANNALNEAKKLGEIASRRERNALNERADAIAKLKAIMT